MQTISKWEDEELDVFGRLRKMNRMYCMLRRGKTMQRRTNISRGKLCIILGK